MTPDDDATSPDGASMRPPDPDDRIRGLAGAPPPAGPPRGPGSGSISGGTPFFRRRVTLVGATVVVVAALVAGVLVVVLGDDEAAAGEVILEPADDDGDDPFFASVATSSVEVEAGGVDEVGGSGDGVESLSGATPGLYGGTGDDAVCDQEALVGFLEDGVEKAAAFADVLGLAHNDIAEYVAGLTPVLLREDTRVTNHGFADGRATPRQAVFQAGTAVLVDDFGVPRVRCACGNPLTEPVDEGGGGYVGDPWSGFDEARLVAVSAASEPQESFEVVDVRTGSAYTTAPGGGGDCIQQEVVDAVTDSFVGSSVPADALEFLRVEDIRCVGDHASAAILGISDPGTRMLYQRTPTGWATIAPVGCDLTHREALGISESDWLRLVPTAPDEVEIEGGFTEYGWIDCATGASVGPPGGAAAPGAPVG